MRKVLCGILIIVIVCNIYSFSYSTDTNNVEQNTTQNTTTLDEQREELEEKIEGAESDLELLQEELSENLLELQELDDKIIDAELEIQKLTMDIEILQNEIDKVEENLEIAEQKYLEQKEIFDQRLIAMYKEGEISYLEILLDSDSIVDFFSSYYMLVQISENDAKIVEQLERQKNEIEIEKEKLEKQKEQLAVKKQDQAVSSRILENTKGVRENYVAKLSEEEKVIQAGIDEYINSFKAVNEEILLLAQQGIGTEYIGGELEWPVPGYSRITSQYGMREHPVTGVYKLHTGLDISAPTGVDFVAANDGIVIKAEYDFAYGNMVIVDHGGGITTLYAHGSENLVNVGQIVKRGEPVLKIGSTGYSTGPHAHFEVRINGISTDPLPYITTGLIPQTQDAETIMQEEQTENTN